MFLTALAVAAATAAPTPTTVATGLRAPWDMAFMPDGRALVTERDSGHIRLFDRHRGLRRSPVGRTRVLHVSGGENGLLGIAVDPAFARNRFVYAYRTVSATENQLVRFVFSRRDRLSSPRVVVRGVPAGTFHNGGRIRFGPDGALYIATGETARKASLAQDPASLAGKILRVANPRGGVVVPRAIDLGHRNVQGLDWEPGTDRLLASEFGPDSDDEVNVIVPGANFGWPRAKGAATGGGLFTPAFVDYVKVIAPTGATFVHRRGSAWTGDFVFATLVEQGLRRLSFAAPGGAVSADRPLYRGRFGRLRSVVEGPDGALYVLTSNTDNRGSPHRGDDRILRIVPPRA